MVQFIPRPQSNTSILGQALAQGLGNAAEGYFQGREKRGNEKALETFNERLPHINTAAGFLSEVSKLPPAVQQAMGSQFAAHVKGLQEQEAIERVYGRQGAGGQPQNQGNVPGGQSPVNPQTQPQVPAAMPGFNQIPEQNLGPALANKFTRPAAQQQIEERRHQEKLSLDREKLDAAENRFTRGEDFKKFESKAKRESKVSEPILIANEEIRKNLATIDSGLQEMETAIRTGNLAGTGPDFLADITGFIPFRSAKGAALRTASKDFFLSNIARTGNRPNQWVEQVLFSTLPQIGQSTEANLSQLELLKFKRDTDRARLDATDRLAKDYLDSQGYVPASVGKQVDDQIKPYVEKRLKQLAYNTRQLFEQEQGALALQQLKEVPQGTPLTIEKARVLLQAMNGDQEGAAKLAQKLGYDLNVEYPGAS